MAEGDALFFVGPGPVRIGAAGKHAFCHAKGDALKTLS